MPMKFERDEPDRDPAVARKTTMPCAIEDGEARASLWTRFKSIFRRHRKKLPRYDPGVPPLIDPETIPEAPDEEPWTE